MEKAAQEMADRLKELFADACMDTGRVFLAADGRFVNSKGDFMHPYDVLRKIEKLRDTVARGTDLFAVFLNILQRTQGTVSAGVDGGNNASI